MNKIEYPQEVEKFLEAIDASLSEDGFYRDFEIEKYGSQALREVAGPLLMKRWVNGDLEDLEDELIEQIMKETAAMGLFFSLRNKGMIDWVEDETGKDVMFVTQEGKQFINQNKNI